jgi:hypothetical protein
MLKEKAPIENSIVICRVKWEEMEHPELKEKMEMITSGVIKSVDYVGLGANEQTDVGIAKSLKGKNFTLIKGEKMSDPEDKLELDLQEDNSEEGVGSPASEKDAGVQTPAVLEDRIKKLEENQKAFSEETTKKLKEAAETALKDVVKEIKEEFKKNYETLVKEEVKKTVLDRTQKAMKKTQENEQKDVVGEIVSKISSITDKEQLEQVMSSAMNVLSKEGTINKK